SITKIMTMLLVLENIEAGKIKWTDKVTPSKHACSMGGSQIWLEEKEQLMVEELFKATAVASANDAAVALGEHVAGSEETFVNLMNKRAKELGMKNTTFKNATGLDADGHLSTAKDIALMSKELLKHKVITKYSTIWMDSLRNGKTSLVNTNKMVRFYKGATGLKTGTTDDAGSCLSASATRDGVELISVTMGSKTSDERFASARKLLDYGFSNYSLFKIEIDKNQLLPVKVLRGIKNNVKINASAPKGVVIEKGKEKDIEQKVTLVSDVEAPVEKNQVVGKLNITLGGKSLGEYNIMTTESVSRMSFGVAFKKLLRSLFVLS
ncbi:MAG: serine-type D-Ala-D-Ala carboxypeptidase, partial [Oscillospiraceae bacterium]|nr:serine-type D-Ala-D-Ala carboxypeptidase [Oscillospiraceae bacterium]